MRVWGRDGRASAWSPPHFWQVGLLRAGDWKARWITVRTPRKTVALDKPIRQGTLFATARGVYQLRLNGSRVSDQVLAPGWTDYRKRVQYQAYDVTQQLRRGTDAIGAIVGDGWHSGYVGFGKQRDHYGDTTALLAQLDQRQAVVFDPPPNKKIKPRGTPGGNN